MSPRKMTPVLICTTSSSIQSLPLPLFLIHQWPFLYFNFCALFFILSTDTTETWLSFLYSFPFQEFLILSCFQAKECQLFQPILAYLMLYSPKQLHGIFLGSCHYFVSCIEEPRIGQRKLK